MRIVASAGGAVALALAVVPMTPVQAASLNPDHENNRIACNAGALTDAISDANGKGGGTIELARDCRYLLGAIDNNSGPSGGPNGVPVITTPITLHGGKGTSIERSSTPGTPEFRIFEVAAPAGFLTLDDLTVRNGHADGDGADGDGGAVFVNEGRTLLLRSVTLTHNVADRHGGAVNNDRGRVIVRSSKVDRNVAGRDGGGIDNDEGVLTIDSSTVDRNTAGEDGGGIVLSDDAYLTLTKSSVDRNAAVGNAGGIQSAGHLFLRSSHVDRNTAGEEGGGMVTNGTAVIDSGSVVGNTAGTDGGGIRNSSVLTIGHSSVNANSAQRGGGIHNTNKVWIGRSVLKDNLAATQGGGLWNDDEATAESTDITGNRTSGPGSQGGGVFNNSGNTVLTDTTVARNEAVMEGGGVFEVPGSEVTLVRTRVKDNEPDNCRPAGAVSGCVG
ncbi:hypothetical protein ABZ557_12500 [Streptomyces sp. NPDC019645]|uniref:hypothetical protein n=1 Tax=Streptomyces sp. NPDC019645 TaxID=3154786 RepID=UPI0033DBC503